MAGAQLAPIVEEARTTEHFVVPAHQRLGELAQNLWWSWDDESTSLFRELNPVLWRELDHNPVALLQLTEMHTLDDRASQLALHGRINYAYRRLQEYLKSKRTWGARHASVLGARLVAYFSAEFGLHESIPDLFRRPRHPGRRSPQERVGSRDSARRRRPVLRPGIFPAAARSRRVAARGLHRRRQPAAAAAARARARGIPLVVDINTRSGTIAARVWKLAVGRNTLLLLDSNVEGNRPEDRELTARLYGGDERVRIRQELLLGIGGVKALNALGIVPGVVHLNEGHSAFAALELVRRRMETEGIDAYEAMRRVSAQIVFTTHTPVPAGHDRFSAPLIEEHLGPVRDALGLDAGTPSWRSAASMPPIPPSSSA